MKRIDESSINYGCAGCIRIITKIMYNISKDITEFPQMSILRKLCVTLHKHPYICRIVDPKHIILQTLSTCFCNWYHPSQVKLNIKKIRGISLIDLLVVSYRRNDRRDSPFRSGLYMSVQSSMCPFFRDPQRLATRSTRTFDV